METKHGLLNVCLYVVCSAYSREKEYYGRGKRRYLVRAASLLFSALWRYLINFGCPHVCLIYSVFLSAPLLPAADLTFVSTPRAHTYSYSGVVVFYAPGVPPPPTARRLSTAASLGKYARKNAVSIAPGGCSAARVVVLLPLRRIVVGV